MLQMGCPFLRKKKKGSGCWLGSLPATRLIFLTLSFHSLGKEGKKALFVDNFMPYLHFNDEMIEKRRKRAYRAIAKCFKGFQTTLVSKYILKKKSSFKCFLHLNREVFE